MEQRTANSDRGARGIGAAIADPARDATDSRSPCSIARNSPATRSFPNRRRRRQGHRGSAADVSDADQVRGRCGTGRRRIGRTNGPRQ